MISFDEKITFINVDQQLLKQKLQQMEEKEKQQEQELSQKDEKIKELQQKLQQMELQLQNQLRQQPGSSSAPVNKVCLKR